MDKTDHDKKNNTGVSQREKDVLRAVDVVPPYSKQAQAEKKSKNDDNPVPIETIVDQVLKSPTVEKLHPSDSAKGPEDNTTLPTWEQISESSNEQKVGDHPVVEEKSSILEFNLADQIMAEQRRVTSKQRKRPGQSSQSQTEPEKIPLHTEPKAKKEHCYLHRSQVIATIVARDIEKLCR